MTTKVMTEEHIKTAPKNEEQPVDLPIIEEMAKVGLFLGHKKSKTHPRMKPFIFSVRNGMAIFDLSKTLEGLNKALAFVSAQVAAKGTVLVVGTTPASKAAAEAFAKKFNFPFVTERWLGGTLTNFKVLSKRIAYFKKLKADRASGKLEKYTKKERLDIDREIEKLTSKFSGIENMDAMPNALLVIDINSHIIAVKEAKKINIPVVAIVNTDADPMLAEYPIPCSDRSKGSIEWVLTKLEEAINSAKPAVSPTPTTTTA